MAPRRRECCRVAQQTEPESEGCGKNVLEPREVGPRSLKLNFGRSVSESWGSTCADALSAGVDKVEGDAALCVIA